MFTQQPDLLVRNLVDSNTTRKLTLMQNIKDAAKQT
jgi:hypothetical protein